MAERGGRRCRRGGRDLAPAWPWAIPVRELLIQKDEIKVSASQRSTRVLQGRSLLDVVVDPEQGSDLFAKIEIILNE